MNNIEMANQIAAAAECLGSRRKRAWMSTAERADEARHIANLRHIAQEIAGSRGGELYPLPDECDKQPLDPVEVYSPNTVVIDEREGISTFLGVDRTPRWPFLRPGAHLEKHGRHE